MNNSHFIQDLEALAPMPFSLLRLTELLHNVATSYQEIGEVVRNDPALTGDVLRYANSEGVNNRGEITSIQQAFSVFGAKPMVEFLIQKWLKGRVLIDPKFYGMTSEDLWKHSLTVALSSSVLCDYLERREEASEAYTVAILHDIGKIVLAHYAERKGIHSKDFQLDSNRILLLELEKRVFGVDHAKVGAMLLEEWGLPESLVTAVELHDDADRGGGFICEAVRFGNLISAILELPPEQWRHTFPEEMGESLGVDREGFVQICFRVSERREEIISRYVGR
jgi:putative nucleotidyltransferase with HDIG domain